jgi:hypothetical protein
VQRKKGKIGRQAVKFRPPPKAKKKPSQGVKKEKKNQFEAREKNRQHMNGTINGTTH